MKNNCYKVILLLILFTALFAAISGCAQKDAVERNYTLKGENEHWSVIYTGHSKGYFYKENGRLDYKGDSEEKLVFTYKGPLSELSSKKTFNYAFGSGGGNQTVDNGFDSKVFTFTNSGSGGILSKEDTEELTVGIDGKMETIVMKIVK